MLLQPARDTHMAYMVEHKFRGIHVVDSCQANPKLPLNSINFRTAHPFIYGSTHLNLSIKISPQFFIWVYQNVLCKLFTFFLPKH